MKNEYEIRGEVTAIFVKYKGEVHETIIDTSDLDRCKEFEFTWFLVFNKKLKSFYVRGNTSCKLQNRTTVALHRWLYGEHLDKSIEIDHKNHNTLDNRRTSNLRKSNRVQNMQNRKGAASHSKSGIRGVHWDSERKKWRAQIQVSGKKIMLGQFVDIEEAKNAVIEARIKYMTHSNDRRILSGS